MIQEATVIREEQPSRGAGWVPWLILWLWCFSLVYYGLAQGRERSLPGETSSPSSDG